MEKQIAVHLADGFEETEAISIIDVLRRAGLRVRVVSVTDKREVTGSHQIKISADALFEEVDYNAVDMIILPGGMPGAKNLKAHSGLGEKILEFNEKGKLLGAICAAPIVFGNLGILEGKKATCFPGFEAEVKGAELTGEPVEKDGQIITGKGVGVALHFALKIVAIFKGEKAAGDLAEKMVVPSP